MDNWYEVVDASDDEAYFTLGGFPSLEEAIRGVEFRCRDEPITCGYDRDEFVRIEIREHSRGWNDSTKRVWSKEWINTYDEEKDDYVWSVVV